MPFDALAAVGSDLDDFVARRAEVRDWSPRKSNGHLEHMQAVASALNGRMICRDFDGTKRSVVVFAPHWRNPDSLANDAENDSYRTVFGRIEQLGMHRDRIDRVIILCEAPRRSAGREGYDEMAAARRSAEERDQEGPHGENHERKGSGGVLHEHVLSMQWMCAGVSFAQNTEIGAGEDRGDRSGAVPEHIG